MMRFALLIAALTLGTSTVHAACPSWDFLYNYEFSQLKNGFSPALVCSLDPNQPAIDTCGHPSGAILRKYICTQSGVSGFWYASIGLQCTTGPMKVVSKVDYNHSPLFTFNHKCVCSESVTTCTWF